jgi:hypothetical protein
MKKTILALIANYLLITFNCYAQWTDAYISDFKVNDDVGTAIQDVSSLGVDSVGNFIIVWNDKRNNPISPFGYQVFCQRYTKEGIPIGINFRIGQDTSGGPSIAMLEDGRFTVLWVSTTMNNTFQEIFFQRFSQSGVPISQATRVNDSTISLVNGGIYGLALSADSSGNFVISWSVSHALGIYPKIYFQRYDSSGIRIGTLQTANEANSRAQYPQLAMNKDGSFVICWQDDRYSYPNKHDIFMQRFDNNGIKIGNNVKVNDDLDTLVDQQAAVVSSDGRGYFVIAWGDDRNEELNIYYQLYDTNGSAIGQNRKATIFSAYGLLGIPKVSMREDRKFFIGWIDLNYSSKAQYYGRRFNSNGDTIGMPYMIPMSSPGSSTQRSNSVYLFGDRVYATWEDTRNGNSDIYCNVRGFQNPDTVIGIKSISSEFPLTFKLYQNFPNPFNPKTTIKYDLPKDGFVTFKVYDILGREIYSVTEHKSAGSYQITLDGSNYASGLYFYRLEVRQAGSSTGNFVETKKMVLIK